MFEYSCKSYAALTAIETLDAYKETHMRTIIITEVAFLTSLLEIHYLVHVWMRISKEKNSIAPHRRSTANMLEK